MITENHTHCMLVGYIGVLQSKWHHRVIVYPNGVRNDIYFLSSGHILIWLCSEKPSIKDILSKPHVLSIVTLVMCNKNSSLGQTVLRSRKLVQTLIFLFFLRMGTMLATQSGCCSPRRKPHSMSLWISVSIAAIMWGPNCHYYWLTGSLSSLMLKRCITTWGSRPGISS